MSTQKGNTRKKGQKYQNKTAFKNDMHDTSRKTKEINSLEFYGLCERCKAVIDWKVKYKKYKPLTVPKKCVKCLEKKVKSAYYVVCMDCCQKHKVCSKCSKDCVELEFGESKVEQIKKEQEFQYELKQLTERQRRKFLRLLEKGLLTKENLAEGDIKDLISSRNSKESEGDDDEDDDDDNEDDDEYESDLDDLDAQIKACRMKEREKNAIKPNKEKTASGISNEKLDNDDDGDDGDVGGEDDDDDQYEDVSDFSDEDDYDEK